MPENTLAGEFSLNENTSSEAEVSEAIENTPVEESADPELTKPAHKSNPHFFSSYCYYPKNVKFLNQEQDEEIILLIRRRFIVNAPWIVTGVFLAIIGPIIIPHLLNSFPISPLDPIQYAVLLAFYFLVIFGFMLTKFTLWYFHIGIVTNKRIKDIDIHGVLFKDIAETKISLIQDVKYSQVGFLPSLFNFGDILVQTAGAEPNIEFDRAPHPSRITKIIGDMIRRHK